MKEFIGSYSGGLKIMIVNSIKQINLVDICKAKGINQINIVDNSNGKRIKQSVETFLSWKLRIGTSICYMHMEPKE